MSFDHAVMELEREWDFNAGFLGKLRRGEFDAARYEGLMGILRRIHTGDGDLPKRFVSLVWYIPLVFTWQQERCIENGVDPQTFVQALNGVTAEVERILGVA